MSNVHPSLEIPPKKRTKTVAKRRRPYIAFPEVSETQKSPSEDEVEILESRSESKRTQAESSKQSTDKSKKASIYRNIRTRSRDLPQSKKAGTAEKESAPSEKEISPNEIPTGVIHKGIWFASYALSKSWLIKESWNVIPEKMLVETWWNVPEVLTLIKEVGLLRTLTKPMPSVHQLVLEFVGNISETFYDATHKDYGVVYVRKNKIILTPESINKFFEVHKFDSIEYPTLPKIAEEITAGKINTWETSSGIRNNSLTAKYAVLHSLCTSNWIPSKNKQLVTSAMAKLIYAIGQGKTVNIGQIMFDNLVSTAGSNLPNRNIGNPSLIFESIIQQAPNILAQTERLAVPLLKCYADHKLFGKEHLLDVERVDKKGKEKVSAADVRSKEKGSIPANLSSTIVEFLERKHDEARRDQLFLAKLLRDIKYPIETLSDTESEKLESASD